MSVIFQQRYSSKFLELHPWPTEWKIFSRGSHHLWFSIKFYPCLRRSVLHILLLRSTYTCLLSGKLRLHSDGGGNNVNTIMWSDPAWALVSDGVFFFEENSPKCRLYATWNIIQAYLDRMLILIVFLLYSGLVWKKTFMKTTVPL